MDNEQTSKEPEAGTWPWLDHITDIIFGLWFLSILLFMVCIGLGFLGGPVPQMLMSLVVISLYATGTAVIMLLPLLHVSRAVWVNRRKILSAFHPKNIAKTTGYIRAQADEYQQREGSAKDTFERLIQQQWDAGEKRLKEIIVASSAFGKCGNDYNSWEPQRDATVQEIADGVADSLRGFFACAFLNKCLWKESVTLVALLSLCADESARCGHDVTAKREFIAKVQPTIESVGEGMSWIA